MRALFKILAASGMALAAATLFTACEGPQGPSGPEGLSCTVTENASGGATITCEDGTTATVDDGIAGEGCTVATLADGSKQITCADGTEVVVRDGVTGAWLTGPDVKLEITDATIDDAGVATVSFTLTDGQGVALDRGGLYTEGAVGVSFVLGYLGVDDTTGAETPYTAYTTRSATSPITQATETQASTDSGGTFTELGFGQGTYTYTLKTAINVADPTLTHTVAGYATRTVDGVRRVGNALYNFVPNGAAVTVTRELVTNAACNTCHDDLAFHGGSRKEIGLCISCHNPGTVDPDTGNTVDFRVMIHKIHRGHDLPSVQAGTPYQIIGYRQSVHDYSTVHFPRDVRDCATCHTNDQWQQRPSQSACSSCHDLVSFVDPAPEGMNLHSAGAKTDAECADCHKPTGLFGDQKVGIVDAHLTPALDPARPKVAFEILGVTNSGPGQIPTVNFKATVDGVTRDLLAEPMSRVAMTFAGPNADIADYSNLRVQGGTAAGTLTAVGDGTFNFTPTAYMIPADAVGSAMVGIEGYVQDPVTGFRNAALNPVFYFPVTDTNAVARRKVVDVANCNSCHGELAMHGGSRTNPDYCVTCHNANNSGDERISKVEGQSIMAESVHLKVMIHKIHRGEDLAQQPYILGGYPPPSPTNPVGNPINFGELRFPGNLAKCETCHVPGSYTLPIVPGALPSMTELLTCAEDPLADADDFCNLLNRTVSYTAPAAAACTSCHDSADAVAHAEIMTTASGVESCAVCHGPGTDFDVELVHAGAAGH